MSTLGDGAKELISALEETQLFRFKKLCELEHRRHKLWVRVTPAFGLRLVNLALNRVTPQTGPLALPRIDPPPVVYNHEYLRDASKQKAPRKTRNRRKEQNNPYV